MQIVENPTPIFLNSDGTPLTGGYLYFGAANQNPETAPTTVYWDFALTQPAAQPIRTIAGMPSRNGTPCNIYTNNTYSLTVRDSQNRVVYSFLDSSLFNMGSGQISFARIETGAVSRLLQDELRDFPAPIGDYNSIANGMAAGGIFSKVEGASNDVWYWGRYMSGTKATGANANNLGYGPAGFHFDISQDTADCGGDFMRALYGRSVFGGSTVKGGRIGVLGEVIHQLGATNGANTNRNYVGMVGIAHSETGDGGADATTNAKGAYFGLNGIGRAAAGATNIFEVAGCELNTYVGAGSSMRYLFGATIAGFNMVHGSEIEAALEIGGGTDSGYGPHVGWNNGILFSNIHGSDPTNANTTLIGAYFQGGGGLRTIKAGLDTTKFTCTSGIVLGPNLVLTDNTLSLGANGANVSSIQAGNNVAAANMDISPKGGGAIRLYDGMAGTIRLFIDAGNGIRMVPLASATPQANGELAVQATSNTSLTFRYRGSDAVVRQGSLALA